MGAPTNILPRLEPHRSYILCPTCEDQGHPDVEMRRPTSDSASFECPLRHTLDVHTVQKLVAAGRQLHMVPLQVIEQPPPGHVKASDFWIHPETLAILKDKFKGRIIVTMNTFFNMLCDPDLIFINGQDAAKLKRYGLNSGKDILAMAEGRKELEETHRALIERITPILNAASAAGGD